jgi:predicted NBD/HSP70 family sugar kinase
MLEQNDSKDLNQPTVYLGASVGPGKGSVESFPSYDNQPSVPTRDGREEFPVTNDFHADFQELLEACKRLAVEKTIGGIGLALAGHVTQDRTDINVTGTLTDWVGRKAAFTLAETLKCRVVLGNDAEAAALAGTLYGDAPPFKFAHVIWDVGVSGCEVFRTGQRPLLIPSELGHQIIDPTATETRCGCGNPGCLESRVGGWGLERFGRPSGDLLPPQQDEMIKSLVIGLHNTQRIISVPNITFSGSLATTYQHLLPEVKQQLQRMLGVTHGDGLIVRLAGKEATVGNLGAVALLGQGELFDI